MKSCRAVVLAVFWTVPFIFVGLAPEGATAATASPLEAEKPLERRVSHILTASEKEALEIRREILESGGDRKAFRAAARKHSKDVTTKRLGGDLGWIEKGDLSLDPHFLEAALRLKMGRVSEPVRSQYGWHLIFVEKERGKDGEVKAPERSGDEASAETTVPEAVRIVERYVRVAGGRETFETIRDRTTRFDNVKRSETGETVAAINLFLKRGVKIREEWEIKGFQLKGEPLAFVQVYDGEQGWVKMTGTVSSLEGRTLAVFVWDKYIDDFFLHWEEDGYQLKYAGKAAIEGKPTDIIEAEDFTGRQRVRYFFSKANGLLVKKEWEDSVKDKESGESRTVTREQYYKKYTKVPFADGSGRSIRFPKLLEIDVDGERDTERIYKEVSFNTGLSDDFFGKPPGKPFIPEKKAKRGRL